MNGRNRVTINELGPGEVGATVKLKTSYTGNTLCSGNRPVKLHEPVYPKPMVHAALLPQAKGEEDKIAAGLAILHEEDPTFVVSTDPELHQTILAAQGELLLVELPDRLPRRFKAHFDLLKPQVPSGETIKWPPDAPNRKKKQSGGAGQFADGSPPSPPR